MVIAVYLDDTNDSRIISWINKNTGKDSFTRGRGTFIRYILYDYTSKTIEAEDFFPEEKKEKKGKRKVSKEAEEPIEKKDESVDGEVLEGLLSSIKGLG